jgi:hypothetical protein
MKENTVSLSICDPKLIKKLPSAQSGKTVDLHVKCHVERSGDSMETDYRAMDASPMSKGAKSLVNDPPKYRTVHLSGRVIGIGTSGGKSAPAAPAKSSGKMSAAAKALVG